MRKTSFYSIIALSILILAIISLGVYWMVKETTSPSLGNALEWKKFRDDQGLKNLSLVDPETAPTHLKDEVLAGYNIMIKTGQLLPEYVGDKMTCTNCHISGGNTTGGKRGGISLMGVVCAYPCYNKRAHSVMTIEERIQNCFERSMNGKAIACDSKPMKALVTYLTWISKGTPVYSDIPWRGLKDLKSKYEGNAERGKSDYMMYCADCHGKNGEGEPNPLLVIPPVWGPHSFNAGAGMATMNSLSSFIYWNMPYERAELTEEQAIDIAKYILTQPRPALHHQ